jgi:hypothetical protein
MCKTYGHLAYTKKSIEQQMEELEQKMSVVSELVQKEQEKLATGIKNERS